MIELRLRRPGTPEDPLTSYRSLEEFDNCELNPTGRFSIEINSIPIDFRYEDRGFDTTVVCFHGAVQTQIDLPFHIGHGVMNGVQANRLAISDPSLLLGGGLKLAWYAGSSQQPNLQAILAAVVARVMGRSTASRLVFFGTSGGGFAALEMSSKFAGSLAVVVNPQTSIQQYYESHVAHYVDKAWGGESPFFEGQPVTRHDLTRDYPETPANTIAYIQNTRDSFHARNHEKPFMQKVKGSPNVYRLRDAWGDPAGIGHVPPPKPVIAGVLSSVASARAWSDGLLAQGFAAATPN